MRRRAPIRIRTVTIKSDPDAAALRGVTEAVASDATATFTRLTLEPHHSIRNPRDEAIFLLHTAAEIEHALMAQYLFAAYSLRDDEATGKARQWKQLILQIAREEMGHLATVQNLLRMIGGPLNFEREDFPFRSELYPFNFKLERLTAKSLAKYIAAERPAEVPADQQHKIDEIDQLAREDNDGMIVNRVGALFVRLRQLFGDPQLPPELQLAPNQIVQDGDFVTDAEAYLAMEKDWGYRNLLVLPRNPGTSPANLRRAAVDALSEVGEQGEGFNQSDAVLSHFEVFFEIYMQLESVNGTGGDNARFEPTRRVPDDPQTSDDSTESFIANPRSQCWAVLFNLRYRLLIGFLSHFLQRNDAPYVTQQAIDASGGQVSQEQLGDRTPKGFLLQWTFNEMRRLRKIAERLVELPLVDDDDARRAGPPFEMPYTLNLPDREADRWRTHADVIASASDIAETLQADYETTSSQPEGNPFLADLLESDSQIKQLVDALAAGQPLSAPPRRFQKAVAILDESVRGFDIASETFHGNFWADKQRDDFVGNAAVAVVDPDVDAAAPRDATLIRVLTSDGLDRMPRDRPAVPPSRIEFLESWVADGCPDNQPPGQIGIKLERRAVSQTSSPQPPAGPAALELKPVAQGLNRPAAAVSPPGDRNRLFVIEQHTGAIRIVDRNSGQVNPQPFLTIGPMSRGNEQGLLGLAFHPDYANNGLCYVNFTAVNRSTNIRRFQASAANPDMADADSAQTVLKFNQPQTNHNGGWIGFGRDGFLYIATGDGGGSHDNNSGHNPATGNAQDTTNNLLGKMLRIDVNGDDFPTDSERNYAIPESNPFVGQAGDDEIWSFGLRNPWRCSFDRQTGDLYIGDVGQHTFEEINFQRAGSPGGENYGWRLREGFAATPIAPGANVGGPKPTGAVDPIHTYQVGSRPEEGFAIIGGYVYRGTSIPRLAGAYVFGDHNGNVWSLRYDGQTVSEFQNRTEELTANGQAIGRIASFGEDEAGELYICTFSGTLFRLAPRTP